MTVVVAVKVYDGIVLAADSATSLPLHDTSTPPVVVGHQVGITETRSSTYTETFQ